MKIVQPSLALLVSVSFIALSAPSAQAGFNTSRLLLAQTETPTEVEIKKPAAASTESEESAKEEPAAAETPKASEPVPEAAKTEEPVKAEETSAEKTSADEKPAADKTAPGAESTTSKESDEPAPAAAESDSKTSTDSDKSAAPSDAPATDTKSETTAPSSGAVSAPEAETPAATSETPATPAPATTSETPATSAPAVTPETAAPKTSETESNPATGVQTGDTTAPKAPETAATLPPPPPEATKDATPAFTPGFASTAPAADNLQEVQKSRKQRVLTEGTDGAKLTVFEEPDNRVIVQQGNRTFIRHDETTRFATSATAIRSSRQPDGFVETVVVRPGGVEIVSVMDDDGRLLRRYRRDGRREIDIIDNRRFYEGVAAGAIVGLGIGLAASMDDLPPPRYTLAREEYIVEYEDDIPEEELYETFMAPPVEELDRPYSLEEVRYSRNLRDRTRRVDLDTINFAFGQWELSPSQYPKLERLAKAMKRVINRNGGEVFMIEGHTDAVGSNVDNLSLSDRRAETVAQILSDEFGVPPENLVTQGYGEEFLKVPTQKPNPSNRRVAVRRITQLMAKR